MTTLALVGGILPLALGTGPSAEERRDVVVIGGQMLSVLLTLLLTPVAHLVLGKLFSRKAVSASPIEIAAAPSSPQAIG